MTEEVSDKRDKLTEGVSKNTLMVALISILILSVAINYAISSSVLKTGSQGEIGDTGEQGAKGDIGLTGAKGSTGSKGDIGSTGAKGATGSKGDRGYTGATGAKGSKGDQGEPGGVEPYVSALLDSEYYGVWGTDYHVVEGFLVNFGSSYAQSVTVKITWHNYGGGSHILECFFIQKMAA